MRKVQVLILAILMLLNSKSALAGDYFNKHLPKWIKLDLEVRHRFENQDNFDFNDAVDGQDSFSLFRTRFNLQLLPTEQFKFFVQFQDARVWDQDKGSKAGNEDYADIRQGYIELKDILKFEAESIPDISFRLGRQELSYGAQRLIGGFNWSNVAQTFEAGKVMLNFPEYKLTIDGFGGTKTPIQTPRDFNQWFDNSTKDEMGGYYATYKGIENTTVEQYFIKRLVNTNISFGPSGSANTDAFTFGGRVFGKIKDTNFDYDFEAAKQWGEFGALDVDTQMAIAIIGYTLADVAWTPRLAFEFDYGSGDDDRTDGELNTFNNLYPTNHLFYGFMDRASLQNLNNYVLSVSAKPCKKVQLQSDLHFLFLDTSNDSLYSAARTVIRTASASSGADEHIGNELDFTVKYNVNDHLKLLAGVSHFFAGDFLDDTGEADDADYFYLETNVLF